MNSFNIAVMVSGNGSNLQAIIDSVKKGDLKAKVKLVISDKIDAYALKRAKDNNIDSIYIKNDTKEILKAFKEYEIDMVVLAGYLSILEKELVEKYKDRIINIHPSLIPKYCGKGYYGIKVHEKVIENKEEISGATVHYVDSGIDTGSVIIQEQVKVSKDDTAKTLQEKVLKVEHKILIQGINLVKGKLETVN